jgi:hypothetical protein
MGLFKFLSKKASIDELSQHQATTKGQAYDSTTIAPPPIRGSSARATMLFSSFHCFIHHYVDILYCAMPYLRIGIAGLVQCFLASSSHVSVRVAVVAE